MEGEREREGTQSNTERFSAFLGQVIVECSTSAASQEFQDGSCRGGNLAAMLNLVFGGG